MTAYKHVKSSKEHWDGIYQAKDYTDVGWYQPSPDISLDLLRRIHARPEHSIIDVGCGASKLVDKLIKQGFREITLVDLSITALDTVKSRLGENAGIPEYQCVDILHTKLSRTFDIWHDRAVFHFLTDEQDRMLYMAHMSEQLVKGGHAIIGTFSLNGPEKCSGLEVVRYDQKKIQSVLPGDIQLVDSITDMHVTPDGGKQEYMFFVLKHR